MWVNHGGLSIKEVALDLAILIVTLFLVISSYLMLA